jgi:hypothetical protein
MFIGKQLCVDGSHPGLKEAELFSAGGDSQEVTDGSQVSSCENEIWSIEEAKRKNDRIETQVKRREILRVPSSEILSI